MARTKFPQYQKKDWLEAQIASKPLRQVAEENGSSYSAVLHAVRRHGLSVPHRETYRYNAGKSAAVKAGLQKRYPNGRVGEDTSNWRGGRGKDTKGYVLVHAPGHPRARQNRIFEHILVMEEKLGRYLASDEVVHHINHVRDDNRPENLEVKERGQHTREHFDAGRDVVALRAENERLRALLKTHNVNPKESENS